MSISGVTKNQAVKEFEQSCERIFYYASMTDKFEGNIHNPPIRGLTLAVKEPIGIVASIMNDNQPLLSLSTIISSLFANANASIIVPSENTSLISTSLYQVFETSDIPAGSINILTTKENELNETLAQHENIHGIWAFSNDFKIRSSIIHDTVSNLKRFWCPKNNAIDWSNSSEHFLNEFLYEGSQVKNIWIPYGE